MKIMVTGGSGFIGSAVVRKAIKEGHSIINVDILTYASTKKTLSKYETHQNYTFEKVDIKNKKSLDNLFSKHEPDVVMHLAAESHVDRSIDGPIEFINTNIIGTFSLLQSTLKYWKKRGFPENFRFHHISTDEVFGSLSIKDPDDKFNENTPYNPRSPYSASKASSDHLVRAWYETYGLPIIITNCSNNYGPYQFPEKLIPVTILNAIYNKPIPIYGNGNNIRDWIFVEDHADALIKVLSKGKVGRSYNIGGNNECNNLHLVKILCKILDQLKPKPSGSYADLITFVSDRPGHDARYAIDTNRIKKEINWQPMTTFKAGLEITSLWYLNNKHWWKPLLKRNFLGKRLGTIN